MLSYVQAHAHTHTHSFKMREMDRSRKKQNDPEKSYRQIKRERKNIYTKKGACYSERNIDSKAQNKVEKFSERQRVSEWKRQRK